MTNERLTETGRRERRRAAKRKQIVSIATEHFFAHGYDSTSMSAIAAQLGGSKGTLWHHFHSKKSLFAEVVSEASEGIADQLSLPAYHGEPVRALTAVCRSIIDWVLSPKAVAMCRMLAALTGRQPDPDAICGIFSRGPLDMVRAIGEYLRENLSDVLEVRDWEAAAMDLLALSSTEFHFRCMWGLSAQPNDRERDARARRAALHFLRLHARNPEELPCLESFMEME